MQTARELIVRCFLQNGVGLLVSQPARTLDEGAGETGAARRTVFRQAEENGTGQPNDIRIQTADAIAQALRQHRDDPIDEVNAVSAPQRLAIERATRHDVGRDVRDVNSEFPLATRELLDVDRIVEIACVVGVNRDDEFAPQILALLKTTRVDRIRDLVRLGQHFRRELERKIVLPDDREHVDAGIGSPAEEFDDFAFGIHVTRLPRFQPNDHFVGRLRPPGRPRDRARLHVNVVHHPGIIWYDVEKVSRLLQGAHDRVVGALQNPDDAAFRAIGPAAGAGVIGITRDPRDDAIAVHRRAGIFRRNKNVALVGTFAGEKCKASLMDLQLSGDEVRRLRKDVAILADARDLA